MNFFKEAKDNLNMMISTRRTLHMNPEIDRDLKNTADLVENCLKELNIHYIRFDNCGIVGEIGFKNNKIIALRADMDALEVMDLKNVPYKSQIEGRMHACGHDAHTAILLGAAAVLKKYENELDGKVKLIFQPAEETDGGARDMINLGALKGVEAIVGLHVDETLNTGHIGVKRGVVSAASNPFTIKILGKGSHGAHPEDGVDAIYIASKVIDNLQGIISREIAAVNNAVISIGKINGGTAPNAICSSVTMEGIIRTLGKDLRDYTKKRVEDLVKDTASMYRGSAEVQFIESYPSYENDEKLFKWFTNMLYNVSDIVLREELYPSMGVEDFAYYTEHVPGLYYKLGCRNESKGIINPAHGSFFDIDENCLIYGCAVQAMTAYNLLKKCDS